MNRFAVLFAFFTISFTSSYANCLDTYEDLHSEFVKENENQLYYDQTSKSYLIDGGTSYSKAFLRGLTSFALFGEPVAIISSTMSLVESGMVSVRNSEIQDLIDLIKNSSEINDSIVDVRRPLESLVRSVQTRVDINFSVKAIADEVLALSDSGDMCSGEIFKSKIIHRKYSRGHYKGGAIALEEVKDLTPGIVEISKYIANKLK